MRLFKHTLASLTADNANLLGRFAVSLIIAFFILWGPFFTQIVKGKSRIFRPWAMFNADLHFYSTRYYLRVNNEDVKINRSKVSMPQRLWRLENEKELREMGQLLCIAHGNKDIRLKASLATKRGWKIIANKEKNICPKPSAAPVSAALVS